jgi:ornithine cyclodeaminase
LTKAEQGILYLKRAHIEQICRDLDTVAAMRDVFRMHGLKQTLLPEEAYLSWVNDQGETVRSLNMPGYLGETMHVAGTKIINSNVSNPLRGLPRASGLTLLYDDTSARINCIMEAAYLSSLRTASVTLLAADLLQGPVVHNVALLGAGVLAQAHIELLVKRLPHLQRILIFDLNPQRVQLLQQQVADVLASAQVVLQETSSAEEAIRPAQLIIPVTTVIMGYIRYAWLAPGCILVNISLDDPLPEVVLKATTVIVDDWNLVRKDHRRLLGRMYREGRLLGPQERSEVLVPGCRRVEMQLGDLATGSAVGRHSLEDIILVNPFGLSLEDLVLAARVYQKALALQIGMWLER